MERVEQRVRVRLRFYLDEDLSQALAIALGGLEYDAIHTRAIGHARQIDPKQLAFARRRGRVLITANYVDFRMLHEAWRVWAPLMNEIRRTPHPGILVVPNPNAMPVAAMAGVIDDFAQGTNPQDVQDRLIRWREGRGWEDVSAVR